MISGYQFRRHTLVRGGLMLVLLMLGAATIIGSGGQSEPSDVCLVTIHRPADGSVWTLGQTIVFQGSGHNPDDDLPFPGDNLSWYSNLDGALGTGSTITPQLSVGNHAITLSCEDSGAVGSVAITVIITE